MSSQIPLAVRGFVFVSNLLLEPIEQGSLLSLICLYQVPISIRFLQAYNQKEQQWTMLLLNLENENEELWRGDIQQNILLNYEQKDPIGNEFITKRRNVHLFCIWKRIRKQRS